MISLKKLLTEDVNYILKKSPNAIIAKAADLMAGVFRIKFKATRDEETPPNFEQDIMYVLTSPKNTQYGPASKFANGDWYYVIGDDRKQGSERRLVTDVLIYPKRKLVNVDKGKQEWEDIDDYFKTPPKSSGKVGSSDVIKVSDFVSVIEPATTGISINSLTGASLIKQINDILNNTIADVPSGDEKIVVVKKGGSSSDTKEKTAESKFKPGDTFVAPGETHITLFKLKDTFDLKTDIKTTTSSNNVTYDEINGLYSNSRYLDSTPEWLQFEKEMVRSLREFKFIDETTPLNTKYGGYTDWRRITKEQYDRLVKQINDKQPITTDLDTFFSGKEQAKNEPIGNIVLTYTSQYDDPKNPGVKNEQKITKQELIDNRSKTSINWIAEAFQQLIMQKVVPVAKFKEISPAVVAFSKLKKPVDGNWGTRSKDVIYELNQAYSLGDTDEILPQLIDKLTAPLKTESVFSLKSILQEIKLQEQDLSGLDAAKVKPRTSGNVTAPTKKEVPKSTTPAVKSTTPTVKTTPKTTATPKKVPAKTTAADTKSVKVAGEKPFRRGISDIAELFKIDLQWDAKLKVWWFDAKLRLIQGPNRTDSYANMHVRDDGTITVKQDGNILIQGINSGWSDGGQKLNVRDSTGTQLKYSSTRPYGWALLDTLYKAVKNAAGWRKPYILNLAVVQPYGGYTYLERNNDSPTTPDSTSKKTTTPAPKPKPPAPKRGIEAIAKLFYNKISYDTKLKVWWFDAKLKIVRGPKAVDEQAFLHVRDDGTITVKRNGATIIQGIGSGWSESGNKLRVKLISRKNGNLIANEKTFTSTSGLVSTLGAAIKQGIPYAINFYVYK